MWNRMVPYAHVVVKHREGYLGSEGSTCGARSPSPVPGFPVQGSSARRELPITSNYKNRQIRQPTETEVY